MNPITNPGQHSGTILIVEDSPTQAAQLTYLLEQHHYQIVAAESGAQALAVLREQRPILVITDIVMPQMSGYELCQHIKAAADTEDIPVILLTSLSRPEDVLEGLACGAESFITKPYSEDYLLTNIKQVLANSTIRKTERVRIGVEILFAGKKRFITADQHQMLSLLISTYEAAVHRNKELVQTQDELRSLNERLEDLVDARTAALSKEILERRKAEERVRHVNSVIRAIRNVNQLITKERDRDRLMQGACENLVSTRGFSSAWIAVMDESGTTIYCTEYGSGDAVKSFRNRVENDEQLQCVRRAMRQSAVVVTESISKECESCPLRCSDENQSALSIRLEHGGKIFGVLTTSLGHDFALDMEEQELFQEVGEDIAFALFNIEGEEERLRAEKALIASEERMRVVIESSPVGIKINDRNGRLVYVNPALVRMFGYDNKDELIGSPVENLFAPEARPAVVRTREDYFSGRPAQMVNERVALKKDGKRFEVNNYIAKIDFAGEPAMLIFSIDVSAERGLQAQLQQAQKMEAIGRLAGGIAHDFNNLLTSILGFGDIALTATENDAALREDIEEIIKAGQKAASLTRQLLAFSRKQTVNPEVLNLNEIIIDLNKMIPRVIGENIEVATALAEDLGSIKIDPTQIEQILMNLLVNAKDAMPSGGRVTIETSNMELDENYALSHGAEIKLGLYVLLTISDTGFGMDKETKDKIFEPFFTTKDKGKGTGLGLSTVYGIVKQNSGYIWVYSEPAQGTVFKLYFPITDGEVVAAEKKQYQFDELKGNETILLVEDEEAVRSLVQKVLEKFGYTVWSAKDGTEALDIFERYCDQIQLIITDVVMPNMSGRDLVEILQSRKTDIRQLYMSGYTDNTIAHHGILEEGVNFIEKPFSPEKIALKVRQVLDKR